MFTLQLCWIIQDVLGPASHPIEDERSQKHRSHLLKKRYFPQNISFMNTSFHQLTLFKKYSPNTPPALLRILIDTLPACFLFYKYSTQKTLHLFRKKQSYKHLERLKILI